MITAVVTTTSVYLLDLDRSRVRRIPGAPTAEAALATLRKDDEWVPLVSLLHLQVGDPMEVIVDVTGGDVSTYRVTTPVRHIGQIPHQEAP